MFHFFGGGTGKHYTTLQVEKNATQADIKKAYRTLAKTHHPDKGGEEAKFKEISQAYEVLVDEEKRRKYDQQTTFSRQKNDVHFRLEVRLEDLYNGCSKKIQLTTSVKCKACHGLGGKNVKKCLQCEGQGQKEMYRQLVPGLLQRYQVLCENCKGQGETIQDRCEQCQGLKTQTEKRTLTVPVSKGKQNGDKIVLKGEADESLTPGDVIVELVCNPHETFERQGDHLMYQKKITLLESVVGFQFFLEHLDKRILQVTSHPGTVYPHHCFKALLGEGMPTLQNVKGNLYIQFLVVWPATVDPTFWQQLLPYPVPVEINPASEKVVLTDTEGIPKAPAESQSASCRTQ